MSVLVIEHPHGGGPENFLRVASVLRRKLVSVSAEEELPDPSEFSSLVVMGGLENVDEQDLYPYLSREIDYMRSWVESSKPLLGVCLGAQLLSLAVGGSTEKMDEPEIGWHPFYHEDSARLDRVVTPIANQVALQWHSYTTLPPDEARVLARNDYGVQAFRYRRAWGVQFHPEGNRETIERWSNELSVRGEEEKIAHLRQGIPRYSPRWRIYGSDLFGRFLALSSA